jgi:hypothetical protein
MKLKNLLEITTSLSVGSNLIPQRWLKKFIKVGDGDEDLHWFTKQNNIKIKRKRDNEVYKPVDSMLRRKV